MGEPHEYRWHVHVWPRRPELDGHGRDVLADARHVGFAVLRGVHSSKLYFLEGRLSREDVELIARELLTDPVAEECRVGEGFSRRPGERPTIEVQPRPGVMNPVALTALDAARRLLAARGRAAALLNGVQTARRYEFDGVQRAGDLEQIARRVLANDCIEAWYIQCPERTNGLPEKLPIPPTFNFQGPRQIPLRGLSTDALRRLSREAHLFLTLEEMQSIQRHFARLDREPTDLELETLAQTWSEHCVHKTLKSAILYQGEDFGRSGTIEASFDNLLKETIVAATRQVGGDLCLSVFSDNAGVVAFDDDFGIAFKVETHNHPSAIEPYGGAATGVGGCIRDIMGCGLGAKPIASTDVFCLAPPDFDDHRVPRDVIHPRRTLKGVVAGVRDYGNRMGIPTVNGAIHFDERFLANPLVFCGCVGLIPRNRIAKRPRPGDRIVVAGGRTGRDGIHGATFSSAELTDTHAGEFAHAVQIGNALEEKKLLDALLIARDHPHGCLFSAVTDCGAGGLSSAVGEMGADLGVVVDLSHVPLKYAGLRYDEIWISEAQERMVFAVPPANLDAFLTTFAAEEVEATVIGSFTDDRRLVVSCQGTTVGDLDMAFLHEGLPKTRRTASWFRKPRGSSTQIERETESLSNESLLRHLSNWNVASKEWVIRQYDHEVQGRSILKPLVGPGTGPSDGAVLRPRYASDRGIALGCGLGVAKDDDDPYEMALAAVDEALRNVVCLGADPSRTAILDNFCWPKVDTEESLGALVRCCRGAHDAAVAYGLPFISGKDSLNNEFSMSEEEAQRVGLPRRLAIPPTLLISALGLVHDVRRCVSMDAKQPGNCLVLASAPIERHGLPGARRMHGRVADLVQQGRVFACHDVSDGGLAVALAEICLAGRLGAELDLQACDLGTAPFGAVTATYVLEMNPDDARRAELPILGHLVSATQLRIRAGVEPLVDVAVSELDEAWRRPLREGGR